MERRMFMMLPETPRLTFREMTDADLDDLREMLCDREVMYAYEHAFSEEEVQAWLNTQKMRYQRCGYGLMAIIKRDAGEMIGQCGITEQTVHGDIVAEIGYLLKRRFWHRGYCTEAARAFREYGFSQLGLTEIFSIIREDNIASQNVARRNGMAPRGMVVKHYYNMDMPHILFSVRRGERACDPQRSADQTS